MCGLKSNSQVAGVELNKLDRDAAGLILSVGPSRYSSLLQ